METTIKAGDVVRLKSGSVPMTVGAVHENKKATVFWIDAAATEIKSAIVPIEALANER